MLHDPESLAVWERRWASFVDLDSHRTLESRVANDRDAFAGAKERSRRSREVRSARRRIQRAVSSPPKVVRVMLFERLQYVS